MPETSRSRIETEIRTRAEEQLRQTHLIVDCYRVRRRNAYPLPLTSPATPPQIVGPTPGDWWTAWIAWAHEERIHALGWAADWFEGTLANRARDAVVADLAALTRWPSFRVADDKPDLTTGHATRCLSTAWQHWAWLGAPLREQIAAAFRRIVEDSLPLSDKLQGAWRTKADILALPQDKPYPYREVHNIQFIGTLSAAIAARLIGHAAAATFDARLRVMLEALLDLRLNGFCEGVAYDGYLLDFIADWLALLPAADRAFFFDHPAYAMLFTESRVLGAPGDAAQVAPLSDVEPKEMAMHIGAQAKCHRLRPNPAVPAFLRACRLDWQTSQSLAAQRSMIDEGALEGNASGGDRSAGAGAFDAQYALVLRSGAAAADLAVAISAHRSPMPHMHKDNGSLVVGTAGEWLISDPGYQQYVDNSERQFAIGLAAHNAPVVNGQAQTLKKPGARQLETVPGAQWRAEVEFAQCYDTALGVTTAQRTVWLSGRQTVVVADRIGGPGVKELTWHWHAHPLAAWTVEGAWAGLCRPGRTLWIQSPSLPIGTAAIRRLKGSRGQQTLILGTTQPAPVIWWIMSLTPRPPEQVHADAAGLRIGSTAFRL